MKTLLKQNCIFSLLLVSGQVSLTVLFLLVSKPWPSSLKGGTASDILDLESKLDKELQYALPARCPNRPLIFFARNPPVFQYCADFKIPPGSTIYSGRGLTDTPGLLSYTSPTWGSHVVALGVISGVDFFFSLVGQILTLSYTLPVCLSEPDVLGLSTALSILQLLSDTGNSVLKLLDHS